MTDQVIAGGGDPAPAGDISVTEGGNNNTVTTPQGDTQTFQQKVAANEAAKTARPDNVPEKFWNAETASVNMEALMTSYTAAEQRIHELSQQPAAQQQAPADAQANAAQDGFDLASIRTKVVETGKLDTSDMEAITKNLPGVSPDLVERFVELENFQKSYSESIADLQTQYIGSPEAAQDLMKWAADNLSDEESQMYNRALASPKGWTQAIDRLQQLQGGINPNTGGPRLVSGVAAPGGSNSGAYQTRAQMMADMRDVRYATDPAFNAQVRAKLGNSDFSVTENRR